MPSYTLNASHYGPNSFFASWLKRNQDQPNVTIIGKGAGVTYIDFPVEITGYRPSLSGVSITPQNDEETSLKIENGGEFYLNDVWANIPEAGLGVHIPLTPGVENYGWKRRGEEVNVPRCSLANAFSVHVIGYDGRSDKTRGWLIENKNPSIQGCFLNHLKLFGGHTVTSGLAFDFQNVSDVYAYGHHVDCTHKPVINMGDGCGHIYWSGYAEPSIIGGSRAAYFHMVDVPDWMKAEIM